VAGCLARKNSLRKGKGVITKKRLKELPFFNIKLTFLLKLFVTRFIGFNNPKVIFKPKNY